jgi:ribonuclease P protein component
MFNVQRSMQRHTLKKRTFKKRERMVSLKLIESLFGGGCSQSVAAFPLRAVYMLAERHSDGTPVQLLISVPKKRFKHAVDRNRVKRQVREAYRQHKDLLYQTVPEDQCLLLAFIWLSDDHWPSKEVEERVTSLMRRISEKI